MKLKKIKNGNINEIYLLEMDGSKYIVRMSNFDNNFECKVLSLLAEYDFSAPKSIVNLKLEDKYIMMYKYIEGTNPVVFDDDFFIRLASMLKELHSIKWDFNKQEYLSNEENQNKLFEFYDIASKSKYLSKDSELLRNIYNRVSALELDNFDKCIVHSDIKKENMIHGNKELYLIDFGNCYVGSRLIDILRVMMWFFIREDDYDYHKMQIFINTYFKDNALTELEKNSVDDLFVYCILYNLLKDVTLFEKNILTSEYIEKNSMKWLDSLKEKDKVLKIGGMIKNA